MLKYLAPAGRPQICVAATLPTVTESVYELASPDSTEREPWKTLYPFTRGLVLTIHVRSAHPGVTSFP